MPASSPHNGPSGLYVFSGNGMSRRVADALSQALSALPTAPRPAFGLVFPVYGWGVPPIVARFVRAELPRCLASLPNAYLWAVMTCGDDTGVTDALLDRLLKASVGRPLDAAFSVRMPDTYIALPGFTLDSPRASAAKLGALPARAAEIAAHIVRRDAVRDLRRGAFPRLKSYVLGGFFRRFLMGDGRFRADASRCTRCGRCIAACPTHDIRFDADGRVAWQRDGRCTHCLRCLHVCPAAAIECGAFTRGKRRLASKTC